MNWYQKNIFLEKIAKKIRKRVMDSDAIGDISYDVSARKLTIKFRRGGTWTYGRVPRKTFENFTRAKSKGRFFNEIIRDKYPII